jgi:ornithine carbamoyltransferase
MIRHLRTLLDIDAAELARILELSFEVKRNPKAYRQALADKTVALIFFKPSTRTRVSFEAGIAQLGGHPMFLTAGGATGMQLGRGETHHDTAKVMSRYVDAIVMRCFGHADIDELARHSSIPVVNALSDGFHPCQALADAMTMRERFGDTRGLKLVFVGPGNNVTHSLMLAGPRAGFDVVCASPPGLPPSDEVLARARADAERAGTKVWVEPDPMVAVRDAHVIYSDTFVSMGQEEEAEDLKAKLAAYVVTPRLMAAAAPNAVFMHCLPAHRGEEVTAEVIDGPQSIIFDQAENRLHSQKALLMLLMGAALWS